MVLMNAIKCIVVRPDRKQSEPGERRRGLTTRGDQNMKWQLRDRAKPKEDVPKKIGIPK